MGIAHAKSCCKHLLIAHLLLPCYLLYLRKPNCSRFSRVISVCLISLSVGRLSLLIKKPRVILNRLHLQTANGSDRVPTRGDIARVRSNE
ncbi:hypothetical protein GGR51DRAFT_178566 [Nemania sp. FL0031]|nr:hypothetical protein GGR51DRAFT_178566 [Nemania sp. FL0031]